MNTAIKVVIGLLCLPLLALGFAAMFAPTAVIDTFGVEPVGGLGLNTIRANVAGVLLGTAAMLVLGLWRRNTTWFLAAAVVAGIVAFGRLVGFAMDGVTADAVPPLIIESALIGMGVLAHKRLGPSAA